MKLVKMSLTAAVLLGASAFAVDNIKVSGDAKLYYNTNNTDQTAPASSGLFNQTNSAADTALRLGVIGDLTKNVSFGATGYAVSTLGLENNMVGNTWTGAHSSSAGTSGVQDAAWMSELWVAVTAGKSTAKVGRMELDTPLAFSEKWSVAANTFDAAVLVNQDIPDTTLVGAWVGKGNGANALGYNARGIGGVDNNATYGIDGGVVGAGANFNTFAQKGAYAVAVINNSLKFLTAQAWYYNVTSVADAYWLQADWDCKLVKDVKIGVQYANMSPKGVVELAGVTKDSSAYAVKLAYVGIDKLNLFAAYSKADSDGVLKIANVGTDNTRAAQSKLYTEAWWNYGYVGAPDAASVNLTAEYDAGFAKLGAYYTDVSIGDTNAVNRSVNGKDTVDMTELAVIVSKSFGPLDTTLAYISTDATDQNTNVNADGARYDSIQAYLTLKF